MRKNRLEVLNLKHQPEQRYNNKKFSIENIESEEIRDILRFICSCGDGSRDISLECLELAFKKCRRIDVSRSHIMAKNLLRELDYLLSIAGMTPDRWFRDVLCSTSMPLEGGRVSLQNLRSGIRSLCKSVHVAPWTDRIIQLLFFSIDSSGCGSFTLHDFEEARHRRQDIVSPSLSPEDRASEKMYRILEFIHRRKARIREIFNYLDVHKLNRVSIADMANGIMKFLREEEQERLQKSSHSNDNYNISNHANNMNEIKLPHIGSTESMNTMLRKRLQNTKSKQNNINKNELENINIKTNGHNLNNNNNKHKKYFVVADPPICKYFSSLCLFL